MTTVLKNYVTKTIVGDYDFKFFKTVKTAVCVYCFKFKVKARISEYDLFFFK